MSEHINRKVWFHVQPAQAGKTFEIKKMIDERSSDYIFVIFTDNNTALNNQVVQRLDEGKSDVINYSSKGVTICHRVLHSRITMPMSDPPIRVICTLTNATRLEKINSTITMCNAHKFIIIIDEIDKNHASCARYIEAWKTWHNVHEIRLVTATPGNLQQQYPESQTVALESSCNKKLYRGFKDMTFVDTQFARPMKIDKYIDEVLKQQIQINPDLLKQGQRWFCPGTPRNSNHYLIKDVLMKHDFNVIIYNQDGLSAWKDGKELDIWKDSQLSGSVADDLAKMCEKHNLVDKPLAVTGRNCIGRGITLQSSAFIFDHAIISPTLSRNVRNLYQLAARTNGNIKTSDDCIPIKIFTNTDTKKKLLFLEKRAIDLPENEYQRLYGDSGASTSSGSDEDSDNEEGKIGKYEHEVPLLVYDSESINFIQKEFSNRKNVTESIKQRMKNMIAETIINVDTKVKTILNEYYLHKLQRVDAYDSRHTAIIGIYNAHKNQTKWHTDHKQLKCEPGQYSVIIVEDDVEKNPDIKKGMIFITYMPKK